MTPDMVLNEPIAISLCYDNSAKYKDDYIATSYVGGSDGEIRILNWIESKALFGTPEHLKATMQRQLFPYWNRYGPGAVIYWFGHILADDKKDLHFHSSVLTDKSIIDNTSAGSVNNRYIKIKSPTKASDSNFWSKYCILMDGFPSPSKIITHDYNK